MPTRDVILVESAMISGRDGGERFRILVRASHPRPVAVEAVSEEEPYAFAALQLGARGCVLAGWLERERGEALEELAAGGVVLTPYLARSVLAALTPDLIAGRYDPARELTEAEGAVLHAIGRGVLNRDVGPILGLNRKAYRAHLRGALEKLLCRPGDDGPELHGSGVPRRPYPGLLSSAAEATPEA